MSKNCTKKEAEILLRGKISKFASRMHRFIENDNMTKANMIQLLGCFNNFMEAFDFNRNEFTDIFVSTLKNYLPNLVNNILHSNSMINRLSRLSKRTESVTACKALNIEIKVPKRHSNITAKRRKK